MGSSNGKPVLREEDIAMLSKTSKKTEEEVKQSFDAFLSAHPHGKLGPKDFKELMAEALQGRMEKKWENMFLESMTPTMMVS